MRKVLFFHAPWCPPCRFYERQFIEPLEEQVGTKYICRINAQDDPFTAEKYMVDRLPTVILVDGEKVIERHTGAIEINKIIEFLKGGMSID